MAQALVGTFHLVLGDPNPEKVSDDDSDYVEGCSGSEYDSGQFGKLFLENPFRYYSVIVRDEGHQNHADGQRGPQGGILVLC